jgi:hypothetical protein
MTLSWRQVTTMFRAVSFVQAAFQGRTLGAVSNA